MVTLAFLALLALIAAAVCFGLAALGIGGRVAWQWAAFMFGTMALILTRGAP